MQPRRPGPRPRPPGPATRSHTSGTGRRCADRLDQRLRIHSSNRFERKELMIITPRRRALAVASAASVCLLAMAGCSTGSGGSSSAAGSGSGSVSTLTEIDYYGAAPQNTQIQGVLNECGAQAGVKVTHQQVPRTQLVPKLLQEAASRSLPDLAVVDNPDLQQLVWPGGLVSLSQAGLSTNGLYPSIVSAGTYKGQIYGIAPGVNGLALFYNKDMFTAAHLQPPTTWDQLTADAKTLTSGSRRG